jgi:hypothetical protein
VASRRCESGRAILAARLHAGHGTPEVGLCVTLVLCVPTQKYKQYFDDENEEPTPPQQESTSVYTPLMTGKRVKRICARLRPGVRCAAVVAWRRANASFILLRCHVPSVPRVSG